MLFDLCRPGRSLTVVEVLKHGWLPRHPSLYYIDMEYCLETLQSRIHGHRQSDSLASESEDGSEQGEAGAEPNSTNISRPLGPVSHPSGPENEAPEVPPQEFDWRPVVNIIDDVNQGLVYLHQNHTVHRDLKPSNGTTRGGLCH